MIVNLGHAFRLRCDRCGRYWRRTMVDESRVILSAKLDGWQAYSRAFALDNPGTETLCPACLLPSGPDGEERKEAPTDNGG